MIPIKTWLLLLLLAVPASAELRFSLIGFDATRTRMELGVARTDSASDLTLAYRIFWGTELATNEVLNPAGEVTFAPGETEKIFVVGLIRNGRVEPAKSLRVHVDSIGAEPPQSAFTILELLDDTAPGGWDYSFPFIPGVLAFAELQDESLLVFQAKSGTPLRILRVDSGGRPYPNFGSFIRDSVNSDIKAHLLPDGAILVGGAYWGRVLVKIDATGAIDPSFPAFQATFVAFQSTGNSLVITNATLARRLTDGQRDPTFRDIPRVYSAAALEDDRIIASVSSADFTHGELFRFSSNGEQIDDVPLAQILDARILAMDDGGFAVAGMMVRDEQRTNVIARWDAEGTLQWERARPLNTRDILMRHRNEIFLMAREDRYAHPNLARLDPGGRLHTDFFVAPPLATLAHVMFGETVYARRGVDLPYRHGDLGRVFLRNKEISEVSFAEPIFNLREKSGGTVTLKRIGDTSKGAEFSIARSGPVGEKLAHETSVVFAPIEREKTIAVAVEDDNLPERDSSTRMELREISGAVGGEFPEAEWRVVDDDGRPGNVQSAAGRWEITWPGPFARAMLELRDGRILVAGGTSDGWQSYQFLDSFTPNGIREDVTFYHQPTNAWSRSAFAMAEQSSGKIVLSGEFRDSPGCLARVNPDGTRDTTFSAARTYACHGVYTLAIQADDRILIAGSMSESATGNGLVRLLPHGGEDRSFVLAPDHIREVKAIIVQPDQRLVVYGFSRLLAGSMLMRLLPTGAHDASFEPMRPEASSLIDSPAVALQADGRILISFTQYFPPRTTVVRLLPNGARDESFMLSENPDGPVRDIFVQADGKIILGGMFTKVGGVNRNRVVRLLPNGEVDMGFDPGVGADISRLLLLRNGALLAGGNFATFNGMPAAGLAYIPTAADVLFLNPSTQDGLLRAIVTGYPGTELAVEASGDLTSWNEVATGRFTDYTAPIAAAADGGWMFLRARSR